MKDEEAIKKGIERAEFVKKGTAPQSAPRSQHIMSASNYRLNCRSRSFVS